MRKLLALSILLLFCLGVGPNAHRVYPPSGFSSLLWMVNDELDGGATEECLSVLTFASNYAACNQNVNQIRADRELTIVSWGVWIMGTAWLLDDACDLHLRIAGSQTGDLFQLGSAALDTAGEFSFANLAVSVAAGELIQLQIEDPTDTTYCADGSGCDCNSTANQQYGVMLRMLGG